MDNVNNPIDKNPNTAKRFLNLKNQIFIKNATDPITKQFVKKIFMKKISRKTGNEIWPLEWEYYSDRRKYSILELYKKNVGKEIEITFSGICQPTRMIIPKLDKNTLLPIEKSKEEATLDKTETDDNEKEKDS